MDNFIASLNVVLPLFIMMSLGSFIRIVGILDEEMTYKMNAFTFKVLLPIFLFTNIYNNELDKTYNWKLVVFSVISIIILYLILWFIIPLIDDDNRRRSVIIQGIYRSNFIIFGIAVCTSLFGESSAGSTAIMTIIIVPLFNILAVFTLESYRKDSGGLSNIIKGIVLNPLIIASILGIIINFIGIKFPTAVEKTLSDISKTATPLALMILGASFKFSSISKYFRQLTISVVGKLIIVPALFIPLSILMGFRDVELITLISIFGAPTSVSSFTMAQQMDANSELASQIVVFTSLISIITMFGWIFITKQIGVI
ncbi:MAG: AEC family transporter [Eubacteriaceae bacterium]